MRLAYVYLKSYGHVRNQEINLDPDWRFAFDGKELTAVQQAGIPPHFFSLLPGGNEVVESVSALVGENGAGKTSIARFLSEFLSGKGVSRDFLVIVFVDGQYFAFYNFYDIRKTGFGRQFDLIPESNRFDLSERDNQLSTWRDSVLGRMHLVYLSPHFTATPIFNSTSDQVVDCSTAGLLAGMGRYGDGMMPVGKFALHEQLSILRVIGAYVAKEDAKPSQTRPKTPSHHIYGVHSPVLAQTHTTAPTSKEMTFHRTTVAGKTRSPRNQSGQHNSNTPQQRSASGSPILRTVKRG